MAAPNTVELSIVAPVYNEEGNIKEFVRRISSVVTPLVDSHEIVFVVDPSTDQTIDRIASEAVANSSVRGIVLSRRFGQPMATIAGLDSCKGRAAVVMDCDLQDPPELIPEMIAKWREGYDVVCARRRGRDGETFVKLLVSKIGYAVIERFGDVPIPRDTGDFRLISRRVITELQRFPEAHGFLRGLVALIGLRQAEVMFDRPARFTGTGKYNRLVGSLRIGFNGVIAFSSALLNLSTMLGLTAALASFLTALSYTIAKLAGAGFPLGNPTIVALVLLLGGLQLICLGITGQYVGRIYDEVKRRPRYIVDYEIPVRDD